MFDLMFFVFASYALTATGGAEFRQPGKELPHAIERAGVAVCGNAKYTLTSWRDDNPKRIRHAIHCAGRGSAENLYVESNALAND
jgi:hypothetical protein